MEKYDLPRQSWWKRQSIFRRGLLIGIPLIVVIGLAVGLGVGLTVGQNGGSGVWQPAVNSSWQIVLLNPLDLPTDATEVQPDVSVYDIDLFTNDAATISTLHSLGKKIICYFSAGSYEPDRPDSKDFDASDKGHGLDGWEGEYWLDLNSTNVRSIMKKRIELAAQKGCDGIDPDNVDGYSNVNGLNLTEQDSVDYIQFLSSEASSLGLATGLKNAGEIIDQVLSVVQFSINEQCHADQECTTFSRFISAGKPVFNIEYPDDSPKIPTADVETYCSTSGDDGAGAEKFSTVMKNMDLDGFVEYCDGLQYNTPLKAS